MEDLQTVWEKINQGEYRNLKPYPAPSLKKTDPEMHRSMWSAYHAEAQEMRGRFWSDVEEEFGTKNSILWAPLRELAWERGHSAGMHEVLTVYSDIVSKLQPDLAKLAKELEDIKQEYAECKRELELISANKYCAEWDYSNFVRDDLW